MESYNLFGDDGSGMLEGLTEIGNTDGYTGNSAPNAAGDNKDATESRQSYQPGVGQESTIPKLPSFSSGSGSGAISSGAGGQGVGPGGPAGPEYHEYGGYPPRPRAPQQPPHAPLHAPHHAHPAHYPGYHPGHPGPDPMYGMPDHPSIADMGVWSGSPATNRYSPITPGYRHSYEHQQKMHQYPPQQGPGISSMQSQNGSYLPRQPHFPQPPTQAVYSQQQGYPSYTQMHPPPASRIPQHPSYHQQMDVNPHQYGLPHSQQHTGISQHQSHQGMGGHQGTVASGIQGGHSNVHLHHSAAGSHHHGARPLAPSAAAVAGHPGGSQIAYPPHHAVSMNYQTHQVQHPLDVNVTNPYNSPKPTGLESPQYRAQFHQISPQVSPRAQISPRQPVPAQASPRPVMSPVKGAGASPHVPRPLAPNQSVSAPPSHATQHQHTTQQQQHPPQQQQHPPQHQQQPHPSQQHPQQQQHPSLQQHPPQNPSQLPHAPQQQHPQQQSHAQQQQHATHNPHTTQQPQPSVYQSPNTLQALEQMVLPAGSEYPYQRNPASPAIGHVPTPSPWNQPKSTVTMSKVLQVDNCDQNNKASETLASTTLSLDNMKTSHTELNDASDNKTNEKEVALLSLSDGHEKTSFVQTAEGTGSSKDLKTDASLASISNTALTEYSDSKVHPSKCDELNDKPKVLETNIDDNKTTDNTLSNLSDSLDNQVPTTILNTSNTNQPPVQGSNTQNISVSLPATETASRHYDTMPMMINRNQGYGSSSIHGNLLSNTQANYQVNPPSGVTSVAQQSHAGGNTTSIPEDPHVGMANTLQQSGINCLSTMSTMQNNLQSNVPSLQNLNNPSVPVPNVPVGMQVGIQSNQANVMTNLTLGVNQSIQSNQNNVITNIPHNVNTNMNIMGSTGISHSNLPVMFGAQHHQERAALQQQIQEIYCLPPSPENQEKVRRLQERLALLQQHETVDKCNGGSNCLLQNSIYSQKMVESPQVSSTTGRGRGKGPARPRKPRAKKEKTVGPQNIPTLDQLPVSEDCVTPGTGLTSNTELDLDMTGEASNLDDSALSLDDTLPNEKTKKQRGPRKTKERKPRTPKEVKGKESSVDGEKPVKERKKREPKDPNAPKRKRNSNKKDTSEVFADTTTNYDGLDKNSDTASLDASKMDTSNTSIQNLNENSVTDFDDIPVSKIAIKDLLEEAEAKREELDKDDDDSLFSPSQKKRSSKKKAATNAASASKKVSLKRVPTGKRKRRGGLVPDSDGEPDDMITTPPPSPPQEGECDSLKRRSARNTQRKKYTDDVMLRLSDEEYPVGVTPKRENKETKFDEISLDMKDNKGDGTPKPNYIYVNTTDEDAMIVQHVLASRMGKREMKPKPEIKDEITAGSGEEIKKEVPDDDQEENKESRESIPDKSEQSDTSSFLEKVSDEIKSDVEVHAKEENNENNSFSEETKPVNIKENNDCNDIASTAPVIVDVEEFYVKYRNFSYLHCEWKTEEELYKGDKRIFSKIKRFKQKQAQQLNIFELLDDEPFNPDYIEVERILDVSENVDPTNKSVVKHYLVKWKSLQYEESTWELEEDIDIDKIKQFKEFSAIPPKDKWKYKKRPPADNWSQIKESPLYKGGNTLRAYQLEGLNWLLFSWHNNRNCILADEMGLGKTIQSLTFVNSVWEYGIRGPFLIIAPLSTIPNWQREFESWTDMNVVVYHGSQQSKSMIQEYEFFYKNEKGEPIKEITKFNVLITTFEIIVTDFQELKSFNWRICVIDEAHRLKNRNCKLLEGLRQLHLEHRVLLSGTPLQNNVNELFSLLNFLEPSQFSSNEAFLSEFGQLKTESEVMKLQALLKPMMLRRLKEDVEKSLGPKEETIIEVELTNIQKKYYRAILERNFSFLQKGVTSAANIPNLMNTMMELRKCCIHPYLLNGAEDQIQFDYKQANGEDKEAYYKALIQSSGKMVLVDKLLPKLKAGGHRVLIFSQMVRCLDILEDYLLFRKYPFERIDGRIRGNLRQEAIDRFSKPDSDRFVFLLCTKAGGLGINLTAADTVIIYDSDWNPQNDLQAQARCHRIGQQKMVKIYRLVCRNSYEREMFDKASLKLGLDKAILQSMNTSQGEKTGVKQLSKKEIEDLLKKGAYGAVMDEDNAGDKFCEEDIEMILARRTQVIQMESEKGSTFSKASFAATDQRSDIDIRDPDFWNKWAKKAEIDTTEKKDEEDLIVTEPRKRTVIKRYGHDDGNVEMSDMEVTPDSEDDEEGISLRSKRKKDKLGRKGRRYGSDDYIPRHEGVPIDEEVVYGSWTRSECFKIERGLLTFGWARWEEIVEKNQFRQGWTLPVIEDCARIIVLYCLRHYKGDEKIRNFIWDLIEPCENGEVTIARNHSGLHNPVPRGRNAKKKNKPRDIPKPSDTQKWEDPNHWSSAEKYDCEAYLESSYKKHLFRHANKVLLRVRMMYYIKHEVIGDYSTQIENGVHASLLGMRVPRGVDSAPPRLWWDAECDVSLLVGSYVHGYENYLEMRSDPQLCFVDKLGPPDDAECTDIKSEERKVRGGGAGDEDCTDEVSSGAGATSPAASPRGEEGDAGDAAHPWPSMQDLNTRLRRIITAYQRNYKREELKLQQRAKMERRERMEHYARDEMSSWRWSRADEEAFRRTVASYGVEFDPTTKSLRWGRFRALARLDTKSDDALTDYLKAFMAMCKRQCGLSVGEAELPTRADLKAEPIGEERAIATLERIDLLRVLREEVAPHVALDARLALCERAPDTPPWWQPARHDKLLVVGVSKHGLGDTYNKLFCDPKLPFTECARKWYANKKDKKKSESQTNSSDEEVDTKNDSEDSSNGPRMSLRRRTRNSNVADRDTEDKDALSELETLAKLGRNEESLPPNHWFSERALETRLHHIAHAVQNCEWPSTSDLQKSGEASRSLRTEARDERRQPHKRHIAIDVETERAKLHALLSSPRTAHASPRERDDASSDSSRRSTPAPPPAHQRAAPAPSAAAAAAPVDLSAPLDLSDSAAATPKSKLDDTLSRLMKRKNVPAPEQIVGKEKKRKKLDEIVLGLSAAKVQGSGASQPAGERAEARGGGERGKAPPVLPNVSVTPVPPPSSSPAVSAQKPFSVTVTNVPSPHSTPKELSSFLQQSLEASSMMKGQKAAASTPVKSFSHEAKVNKWLAEQASVERSRRAPTPRLAPDEHVPVVHRVTGKRIVGNKAPQLKHLAQWIAENPMYDIDSKWTESIKEHVKLPQDVRSQRHAQTTSVGERKKGRPPSLDSNSTNVLSSSAHLNQNLAGLNPALLASLSAFDPKTLASTLSSLTGFDPKLLSGFDPKLLASLSSFDPKNNPLLSSFSSMPNLLGGNLFANLAGLGLPGFSSLDMASLGAPSSSSDSKNKSRKPAETSSTSTSKSNNSQFPFVFPNPNMLYPQLGLGGMNPFGMHSGMSSAYDALGLLSSSLAATSGTITHTHSAARSSTKSSAAPKLSASASAGSAAGVSHSRQQKAANTSQHSAQLPQILLPPDTYLLESLSKQHYDALLKTEKRSRDGEGHEATDLSKAEKKKAHAYDALRSHMPPEFAAVQEKLLKGDKKDIDISKMLLEQMASGALSASLVSAAEGKKKENDHKESMERSTPVDTQSVSVGHKRIHDEVTEPENLTMNQSETNPNKRVKESEYVSEVKNNPNTGEMDLEDLIAPSTVIKTGLKPSEHESKLPTELVDKENKSSSRILNPSDEGIKVMNASCDSGRTESDANCDKKEDENSLEASRNKKKATKSPEDPGTASAGSRRELRSSSLRQSTDSPLE